jgi:hypothetical protein
VRRVNVLRSEVQVVETVARLTGGTAPDTPKSRKSHRTVPIPASLARELGAQVAAQGLGPDDYVFGDDDGKPSTTTSSSGWARPFSRATPPTPRS